jgi:hypothetical protein
MKTKQIILLSLILTSIGFLLGSIVGIIIGVRISQTTSEEKEVIEMITVLEKIQVQSFLVTRTIITNEDTTITIDQGSAWSNLWWGHEITAEARVQVDVGVDLSQISESDITLDNKAKTITIKLPEAQIYDASITGPIDVSTKSGIFKTLFASDTNEDYNLAMSQLTTQSQNAIEQDEQLLDEAKTEALETLRAIFQDTGYTINSK